MLLTTTRKRLLFIASGVVLVGVLYIGLAIRNAWSHKMGGVGLGQMSRPFPDHCKSLVDLHRGSGNVSPGLNLGPRTFRINASVFAQKPECLTHSALAAVGAGPEADYRLILLDEAGREIVTVVVKYPR
jgi:hypothetical protein